MLSIKRIKILDSLRGLAAFVVLTHHLYKLNAIELNNQLSSQLLKVFVWVSNRHVEAVLFFFILSGFSIGLSLKSTTFQTKEIINNYIYRRAKRILPLYWCALSFSIVIAILVPSVYNKSYSVFNLLGNFLFLQTADVPNAWFIPYGDNGPLWSLSYEVFYYLIAIQIVKVKVKYLTNANIFLIVFISIALMMIFINHHYPNPISAYLTLLPIWLIGYDFSQFYLNQRKITIYIILLFAISCTLYMLNDIYLPSATLIVLYKGVLLSALVLLITLIINKINISNFLVRRLYNAFNFIFYRFGQASFSIYIFHYLFLNLAAHYQLSLASQIIGIMILILVSYHFEKWIITKPFSLLKKNYV